MVEKSLTSEAFCGEVWSAGGTGAEVDTSAPSPTTRIAPFNDLKTLVNHLLTAYNVSDQTMKTESALKEILTLEEAAELLDVSRRALREAAARGEVPGCKIARRWRFSRVALHQWLSDTEKAHPYLRHAGALADNPLWEEVQAAIVREREAGRPRARKRKSA